MRSPDRHLYSEYAFDCRGVALPVGAVHHRYRVSGVDDERCVPGDDEHGAYPTALWNLRVQNLPRIRDDHHFVVAGEVCNLTLHVHIGAGGVRKIDRRWALFDAGHYSHIVSLAGRTVFSADQCSKDGREQHHCPSGQVGFPHLHSTLSQSQTTFIADRSGRMRDRH